MNDFERYALDENFGDDSFIFIGLNIYQTHKPLKQIMDEKDCIKSSCPFKFY